MPDVARVFVVARASETRSRIREHSGSLERRTLSWICTECVTRLREHAVRGGRLRIECESLGREILRRRAPRAAGFVRVRGRAECRPADATQLPRHPVLTIDCRSAALMS